MASHEVVIRQAPRAVRNKDLEIDVSTTVDGKQTKLGTLLISKGNLEWLPKGNSVRKKRLTWKKFAELMESGEAPIKSVRAKKKVHGGGK